MFPPEKALERAKCGQEVVAVHDAVDDHVDSPRDHGMMI